VKMKRLILSLAATVALGAFGSSAQAQEARDGSHDFDFNNGVWHTQIKRVLNPFGDGTKTMDLNGTVSVRKVWDGKGWLEEIEADGPTGHWEGLTLFLYDPKAHQWNQSFVNSKMGVLNPPLIGEFKDGRGVLYATDTYQDRAILVRGTWSDIKPDSHHFQEDYSNDGGKTWNPAFIADLVRVKQ
jgi:hypothetical protein